MSILAYLLLLISYDSIPPLPDLSKTQLPEPPLWVEPQESEILINGYAGHFYDAAVLLDLNSLILRGRFEHKDDWTSLDIGDAQCSYLITLPRLWLKPTLETQLQRRQVEYGHITPGVQFTVFTPGAITSGMFDYSQWKIVDSLASEGTGHISCTFDRIRYLPQLTISGIYTHEQLKPALSAQIHIRRFHMMLGSPIIKDLLSPHISITYSEPRTEVFAGVKTGVQQRTLREYFNPEIPLKYRIDVPADTLRIGINLGMRLRMKDHTLALEGSYNDWLCRINTGPDFVISSTRETREINIGLTLQNHFCAGMVKLHNALYMSYDHSDRAIVFMPDYGIADTFRILLGFFELSGDLHYVSQRRGIEKTLPRYGTISSTAGIRLYFMKFYLALRNITDEKSEIYDGYFWTGRQYAGGLEINQRF